MVTLQSGTLVLVTGRIYTFCIWARLAGGPNVTIAMDAFNSNNWAGIGSRITTTATQSWQRLCVANMAVAANTNSMVFVLLNFAVTNFHLDDARLEFVAPNAPANTPVPPPPPPPSPPPMPPPPPVPVALRVGGFQPSVRATEMSTSFETSADGFSVFIDQANAAGTTSVDFASAQAARSGSRGLQIVVNKANGSDWHVIFRSPPRFMTNSRSFTFCISARLGGFATNATFNGTFNGTTPNSTLNIAFLNTAGGGVYITGTPSPGQASGDGDTSPWPVVVTPVWKRFCLAEAQPTASMMGRFEIMLGDKPGTFHFDDASLVFDTLDNDYMAPANVAARAETYRKGDFNINFADAAGVPLAPGALVNASVAMTRHDFPFGGSFDLSQVDAPDQAWYSATFASLFNALSPDYSLKWPSYEPFPGDGFGASYMDNTIMAYARANDLVHVRGHTIEWYFEAMPNYANHWSRQYGCDPYNNWLKARVQSIATRFKGRFHSYDVWNEILHLKKWADRCNLWDNTYRDAFKWINDIDPDAELCINDFDILAGGVDNRWQQMYDMVAGLRASGVPVHCIGIQAYLTPNLVTMELINYRLEALGKLGVTLYISEFLFPDNFYSFPLVNTMDQATLAAAYETYMTAWFTHPYVKGIWNWGFWDSKTFVANSGLFFPNKTEKQAARTIRRMLFTDWWTGNVTATPAQLGGSGAAPALPFRGFYGKYAYSVRTAGGQTFTGTINLRARNGTSQSVTVRLPI